MINLEYISEMYDTLDEVVYMQKGSCDFNDTRPPAIMMLTFICFSKKKKCNDISNDCNENKQMNKIRKKLLFYYHYSEQYSSKYVH